MVTRRREPRRSPGQRRLRWCNRQRLDPRVVGRSQRDARAPVFELVAQTTPSPAPVGRPPAADFSTEKFAPGSSPVVRTVASRFVANTPPGFGSVSG